MAKTRQDDDVMTWKEDEGDYDYMTQSMSTEEDVGEEENIDIPPYVNPPKLESPNPEETGGLIIPTNPEDADGINVPTNPEDADGINVPTNPEDADGIIIPEPEPEPEQEEDDKMSEASSSTSSSKSIDLESAIKVIGLTAKYLNAINNSTLSTSQKKLAVVVLRVLYVLTGVAVADSAATDVIRGLRILRTGDCKSVINKYAEDEIIPCNVKAILIILRGLGVGSILPNIINDIVELTVKPTVKSDELGDRILYPVPY
jgi:hypothetical protein